MRTAQKRKRCIRLHHWWDWVHRCWSHTTIHWRTETSKRSSSKCLIPTTVWIRCWDKLGPSTSRIRTHKPTRCVTSNSQSSMMSTPNRRAVWTKRRRSKILPIRDQWLWRIASGWVSTTIMSYCKACSKRSSSNGGMKARVWNHQRMTTCLVIHIWTSLWATGTSWSLSNNNRSSWIVQQILMILRTRRIRFFGRASTQQPPVVLVKRQSLRMGPSRPQLEIIMATSLTKST